MRTFVDEKELYGKISGNGQLLAPLALITASFLLFESDAWLVASSSSILMAAYLLRGWDTKTLLGYGIVMLGVCTGLIFTSHAYAAWAATQAYWLLACGTVGMLMAHIPALADRKPARPKKYSKDLMKRRQTA